jgi:hypothetical protein
MRILFSNQWQYLGTENGLFKFERIKSRDNGHQEVTLLSDAKYVCRETDVVVYFNTIRKSINSLSISISHATERRLEAGLIKLGDIPVYVTQQYGQALVQG